MLPVTEYQYLLLADGTKYNLTDYRSRFIISKDGFGFPDVDIVSERGPYQHGATYITSFFEPRIIQLVFRHNANKKDRFYTNLKQLTQALSIAQGPITLVSVLSTGVSLGIDVIMERGPSLETRDGWDEWAIHDTIRFVALDPIFYDIVKKTQAYSEGDPGNLVFDPSTNRLVFPFTFSDFWSVANISSDGTWESYPIITIHGPIDNFSISNEQADATISFSGSIQTGQVVIIDLRYSYKTIKYSDGTLAYDLLSSVSNLIGFKILPGTNYVTVAGSATTNETSVSVEWYDKYQTLGAD